MGGAGAPHFSQNRFPPEDNASLLLSGTELPRRGTPGSPNTAIVPLAPLLQGKEVHSDGYSPNPVNLYASHGQVTYMLSEAEANYLKSQRLARIATSSPKGVPEVSPVGFEFDGKYFWVGSHSKEIFPITHRYKNITGGNSKVSLVVDDLLSVNPWRPRGIKVSGTAKVMEHDGIFGKGRYFRISPSKTVSWGIEPSKDWKPTVRHW